jgi:hypothetical protein
LLLPLSSHHLTAPHVDLLRVPDGGIQPQVAVDTSGTIHLVYFKGDPAKGDLFYATSKDGIHFSSALRVNSVPDTAVAIGNIRGARIAVGRRGNVYVLWNGSAKLANPVRGQTPMLFTRLNANHTAFEPEENLIHTAYGIDGGGGVAADQDGRVFVFWHAPIPGKKGEEFRRVWLARSQDDGRSFEPERIAWNEAVGACGCCSLDAYADDRGRLYVLFRSAEDVVHRDMYLLESGDHGNSFHASKVAPWDVSYCVMSSEAFAAGAGHVFAGWEKDKHVEFARLNPNSGSVTMLDVTPLTPDQKYPSIAVNRAGSILLTWTDGMKWNHGGSLQWELLDASGSRASAGSADGVPAWSLVASYPRPNGNFVVMY